MAVDLAVEFHDDDLMAYNTVAEIPGTDLKDEVVMLGGHMDSWHSGTGATDNAAGVAVAMEAVRIFKALDLKPRRTIRIAPLDRRGAGPARLARLRHGALRQGAGRRGSAAPTATVDGEPAKATPDRPSERRRTGTEARVREVLGLFQPRQRHGQGPGRLPPGQRGGAADLPQVAPAVPRAWAPRPCRSPTPAGPTTSRSTAIGLPGFQFIQDQIEYGTRTHHSNQDVYDRIQADDMKQAAVIMAAFVYNTAMRDEKLPRKPAAR